ncbi:MAG: 50S ribosomal protein L11 methyltransferase [Chloroflexi bacterium]|nr:50S ribosomal protein L11 methyltransferase [Chloroflexota bacterium]
MSQRWLEISVNVDPSDADDVRIELGRWVGPALAVEHSADDAHGQVTVRAYVADGPECQSTREALERALWHLGATGASTLRTPHVRWVRPEQYLNEWRAFYRPFTVGRCFVIAPSWTDAPDGDRQVIRLDPGMAFGTGLHPTTQLAVEVLEGAVGPGHDVIDVGTGSGVLAIVAALSGARRVRAVDTDADAVRTARANVAKNGCGDRVSVVQGRLPLHSCDAADIVVANIVADTHLRSLDHYRAAVRRDGRVILGGITSARSAEMQEAVAHHGLDVESVLCRDGWECLNLSVPPAGDS